MKKQSYRQLTVTLWNVATMIVAVIAAVTCFPTTSAFLSPQTRRHQKDYCSQQTSLSPLPQRSFSSSLYYKVLGEPQAGDKKPSVLEEGTNKVVTGNLDGSFRERMEKKYGVQAGQGRQATLQSPLQQQSSSSPLSSPPLLASKIDNKLNSNLHKEPMRHWGTDVVLELDTYPREDDGSVSMAGTVWKASSVLCDYMTHPESGIQWDDMSVIELGSGVGMCGLVAALSGAYVVATDGAMTSLQLIQQNSAKYQEHCKYPLRAESLVWGDLERAYEICQGQYPTFVLASDVVFEGSDLQSLQATLQALCGPETWLLLAHTWGTDDASTSNDLAFFDSFLNEFDRYEADPYLMPPGYQAIQANGRPPVSIFMYHRRTQ